MDTWLILMVVAATIGGAIVGVLGWAKQKPPVPFEWRGFLVSLVSSLIAGMVYAVTLATKTGNFTKDFIIAAVFGAGGDMALRGIVGTAAAQTGKQPAPPPSLPPIQPVPPAPPTA
jgi:hypothetical protein